MVVFGVLGPLQAEDGGRPLDLRGPRHREVLARLLVARGRVVSVARLVDDLWDDPPEGAVGAVQTFVGALRRALEPDRPPRSPARLLVTAAPGYALRARPQDTDAGRFEAAIDAAGPLLAAGRAADAHAALDGALALWRGPAYAEVAGAAWARGEAARLEEPRLVAIERRADAAIALGRAGTAGADLEALVAAAPLREEAWRLLALAQLRRTSAVLRTEAGLDPGPALRQLQADVLAQAPHLAPRPAPPHAPVPAGQDVVPDELVADPPRDHLYEARACLSALAAVRSGDRTAAARLYADLLPAADELAGAGSGLVTVGPTALYLGLLAGTLGRPDDAAAHLRAAAALADRLGAPHWAAAARRSGR